MIVLTFGIDGPEGGVQIDHYAVTCLSYRVEEILTALAPEYLGSWAREEDCDLDPASLAARECLVHVRNEAWQGQDRPRIRALSPFSRDDVGTERA